MQFEWNFIVMICSSSPCPNLTVFYWMIFGWVMTLMVFFVVSSKVWCQLYHWVIHTFSTLQKSLLKSIYSYSQVTLFCHLFVSQFICLSVHHKTCPDYFSKTSGAISSKQDWLVSSLVSHTINISWPCFLLWHQYWLVPGRRLESYLNKLWKLAKINKRLNSLN